MNNKKDRQVNKEDKNHKRHVTSHQNSRRLQKYKSARSCQQSFNLLLREERLRKVLVASVPVSPPHNKMCPPNCGPCTATCHICKDREQPGQGVKGFRVVNECSDQQALCAERVSQMTRTYNDIEAVTRLLEEKERDLELAARIGQSLLEKNKNLEEKYEHLEEQLTEANDKVSQLRHEVSMKETLLQLHVQDYDGDLESPGSDRPDCGLGLAQMEGLHKKVKTLEDENLSLRVETSLLQNETSGFEEKEQQLINDCVKELSTANEQIKSLSEELQVKTEMSNHQREEITQLLSKIIDLEAKIKAMTLENTELQSHLLAAQESQRCLTTEVAELKDKYEEVLGLLQEQVEENRLLQRKHKPCAMRPHHSTFSPFLPEGSLASELESEMKRDLRYPDGYSPSERKTHNLRVMETARAAKRRHIHPSTGAIPGFALSPNAQSTSGNESCESVCGSSNRSSMYFSEIESTLSGEGYQGDTDSLYGSCNHLGRPGIPGSNDLETALRRLSLRRANEINEKHYKEDEERRQRMDGTSASTPCRTPESMMSTGSGSNLSDWSRFSGISGLNFRIPEKLQIVKPIEGSLTLHQWQRLATPHLGGFLDERPGVQIKGERKLDLGEDMIYNLSDYEEDEGVCWLGKAAEQTSSTFTYTTARILHPTDWYRDNTPSPNRNTDQVSTPQDNNMQNVRKTFGTTTYSVSLGLAKRLKERGIQALNTGDELTSPLRYESIVTETFSDSIRSGTEAVYTNPMMYSPSMEGLDSGLEDLGNLNLVHQVQDMGLNNILRSGPGQGVISRAMKGVKKDTSPEESKSIASALESVSKSVTDQALTSSVAQASLSSKVTMATLDDLTGGDSLGLCGGTMPAMCNSPSTKQVGSPSARGLILSTGSRSGPLMAHATGGATKHTGHGHPIGIDFAIKACALTSKDKRQPLLPEGFNMLNAPYTPVVDVASVITTHATAQPVNTRAGPGKIYEPISTMTVKKPMDHLAGIHATRRNSGLVGVPVIGAESLKPSAVTDTDESQL